MNCDKVSTGGCNKGCAFWTYRWSAGGEEDERAEVGGALVAQRAGGIDQSTHTVGLDGGAGERGAPGRGARCGLLGLEELLRRVCLLSAAVDIAKDGAQDG